MQQQLPESADFLRQARQQGHLEGTLPIARLDRLRESLNSDAGELVARLDFGVDSDICYIKGQVQADLQVLCQRCLQPMIQPVSGNFLLGLVTSEEATSTLPEHMEPYLVSGKQQSIIAVLEDELLLSLPLVSMHSEPCSDFMLQQEKQKQVDREAASPFAVLKNLIKD